MSNDYEKPINILELPNEVLREIFEYIPDQLAVGQVCKTFYNISCRVKCYRLKIWDFRGFRYGKGFDEGGDLNENYGRILQSSRQIDTLVIYSSNNRSMTRLRLRKIIEHIGEHVKELDIRKRSFNIHGIHLLNLMPNLERLKLIGIECKALKIPQDLKLRLHKLKELEIKYVPEKFLEVFDSLPDDVLHKLTFETIKSEGTPGKHLQNQRAVKHADIHDTDCIDVRQLKLKSLITTLFENAIKGQDELTSLTIHPTGGRLEQEHVNIICNELKSLEELKLGSYMQPGYFDFSKLQKLKNLKIIRLSGLGAETLKTLKSNSLQCLQLYHHELPEETFLSLSINCPNLREFINTSYENFAVDSILDNFPKLVKLTCYTEELTMPAGYENRTLEHLHSTSYISTKSVEFIKSCKNLKILSVDGIIDKELMKGLLIEVQSLKSLCVRNAYEGIAEIIKEHGKNIACFHQGRSCEEAYVKVKEVLKDQLPLSKIVTVGNYKSFLLKKHGKIEKCCDELDKMWKSKK